MTEQVTKVKNEGRVAAGKRLVEWNRKKKEDLVKNKAQVGSSDTSSVQVPTSPESGGATFYGGGALAVIVVVGVIALYLYREKTTPSKPPPAPEHDIFCMV